jgi:hypothetical protein
VIAMKMPDEDLVEEVVGNLERRDPLGGTRADVEDELLAVAELHKEAGRRLGHARIRHAGTTGDDAHFIGRQGLAVGRIEISRSRLGRRYQGLFLCRGVCRGNYRYTLCNKIHTNGYSHHKYS